MTNDLSCSVAEFGHENGVTAWAEGNFIHVIAHQHEAAATRTLQIFHGGRVRYLGTIKAATFVTDKDIEAFRLNVVGDVDFLGVIELVAVLDGVNEGLFQSQLDAENLAFAVGVGF